MTENDVNLDILSRAIREAGHPVHINVLTRTAVRSWLEAGAGGRRYAPGAQYQAGEAVLFNDQCATVKSVQEGANPVQGSFTVLTLVLSDATERLMAAKVHGAPVEDHRPVTKAQSEAILRAQGAEVRQAIQTALSADPRFVHYQSLQGDHWCLAEILPQVHPTDLQRALAALPDELLNGEPVSRTTEELVVAVWDLEDNGSDTYALHAFALSQALATYDSVVNLGDRWASAQAWEIFTARPTLETPRMPTQVTLPEGVKKPDAAQIEQVQRREAAAEDEYDEGLEVKEPAEEKDLETWRRDHPTHAVFTLHARHYYGGWLPLSRQVRRLLPPLVSGRQEVVFHHHFGDEPESLRALVDREQGRVWLSREMYETFRHHRVYPGARLRLSTRNEREFDIATRETDKIDPIRVWRMWLDEEGWIKYEEHQEPRLYDVSDDVYVADVRFEDREALFHQAERVGNSIFGLMYQQAVEWWEAGEREDLLVTADRLFEAVHFDEQGRMTGNATIAWELWRRLAFESVGSGRYRFRPELEDRVRSVRPIPRHQRPIEPVPEFWAEVALLAGQKLCTLAKGAVFDVLDVDDKAIHIKIASTGQEGAIYRRELESMWIVLTQQGKLHQTVMRNQYSQFKSAYITAILAAMPGVTYQTRPIRLTYEPLSEEPLASFPLIGPAAPRSPELAEPVSECWSLIAHLVGQQLHTLDQKRPFRVLEVGDNALRIRVGTSGEPRTIRRQEVEASWDHLAREGDVTRTEIHGQYSDFNPAYVAAILATFPGVTHQVRPIRLTYQPPSEEPLTLAAPTLERTRTGQLVAADLVPPGPLFVEPPQQLQPSLPELEAIVSEPVSSARVFVMVMGIRDTRQKTGYSRDMYIPLVARDFNPSFWKWPDGFSTASEGAAGRYPERRIDVLTHPVALQPQIVQGVRLYYYDKKHEFRLNCGRLVEGTTSGDILMIRSSREGAAFEGQTYEYEAAVISSDHSSYNALLALCTHQVRGSPKRWGYEDVNQDLGGALI